ncbi:MAG: carotenoid biosynthesis protein [Ignavibacteria bacterium]|nr:carotenoid biosynthesis protein [Ignavibacteria bacterium]
MERKESLNIKSSLVLFIFFMVGAAGYFLNGPNELFDALTPYVLLGTGILTFAASDIYKDRHFIYWFIITYTVILTIEIIGAATGLIFGSYYYGNVLGFKVFGVPLIIGFNWLLIILSSFALASAITVNKSLRLIISPVLAVIMDLLMEPVAVKLGFWNWENDIIPFQNYAAWFIISIAVTAFLMYLNLKFNKFICISYYFSLLIFFLILNLS